MTKDEDSCIWGGLSGSCIGTSKEARYGARYMEVSKPSVCYAVGTLREGGFLTMDEKHYLHLTELGRDAAEKIYERHCFLTKYLISIGVAPATAEADACQIEHDISAETYERLKESVTKE